MKNASFVCVFLALLADFAFAEPSLRGLDTTVRNEQSTPTVSAAAVTVASKGKGKDKDDDKDKDKDKDKEKYYPTEEEVRKTLDDWAVGVLSINQAKLNGEDYAAIAESFLEDAYNFDDGLVLFKPTLSSTVPFRTTLEGALSYFIGENPAFPEDTGFALKPWTSIAFDFVGMIFDENRAILQTQAHFTASDSSVTTAYFSMSLTRSSKKSNLKIDLHHSSLPYSP
jgi:hypothetical protein